MTAGAFARAVRAYCAAARASVTSWGRTPQHNAAVGGVAQSPHLVWMAVDVVYDQQEPVDFRQGLAHSLGLVVLREETHDHLQPADWRP
ncbi:MAG TPA: D-Ala-D-Ala carboxypeptidase family metallohydrolase [Methylomirabilota bacterium]|nr:D-Ala-D-Ala carboxypeptidase family metallohydrolase [Methylomirabilota bacterium]